MLAVWTSINCCLCIHHRVWHSPITTKHRPGLPLDVLPVNGNRQWVCLGLLIPIQLAFQGCFFWNDFSRMLKIIEVRGTCYTTFKRHESIVIIAKVYEEQLESDYCLFTSCSNRVELISCKLRFLGSWSLCGHWQWRRPFELVLATLCAENEESPSLVEKIHSGRTLVTRRVRWQVVCPSHFLHLSLLVVVFVA
jgi:hypothetical protein